MIGIYKITSPSGKIYIGQSWNIFKRWVEHKKERRVYKGKLASSFVKHGYLNHKFEIVHELPIDVDQETLDRYEQLYLDAYRDSGFIMLNIREAGSKGKLNKDSIAKIVAKRKERGNYVTPEHVRKQRSERNRGKPLKGVTREHILQTAEKLRGRTQPEWHKEKNRQAQLGRKHSDETRKKMSENAKALWAKRKGIY